MRRIQLVTVVGVILIALIFAYSQAPINSGNCTGEFFCWNYNGQAFCSCIRKRS